MPQRSRTAAAAIVSAALLAGTLLSPAAAAPQAAKSDWREPAGADWPMPGGDWDNSRYSTLRRIDTTTVGKLGGAWTAKVEGSTRSAPVVTGGRMFVTAGSTVYAFDPKTGAPLWTHKTASAMFGLNKGVAVAEGLVFVGLGDGRLEAMDEKTGTLAWIAEVAEKREARPDLAGNDPGATTGLFISAAPTYANGLVIAAQSGGDFGNRGRVVAFEAKTGKRVWAFDTIPGPGEFGHDSWPQDNEEWKKGGGAVWMTPVVDPDLGLVLFGVGNPVPQWGGELRAGDNLFTDSVVALDLKTGKRAWHRQLVRHDIWEQDIGTPLVLYDAKDKGGKTRKGVAIMRTDGYLFLLDRKTGEPIFPIEERPVPQNALLKTAPTQPFPVGADQLGPRCVDPDMAPPGFKLGCSFDPIGPDQPNTLIRLLTARAAPMAYSPETGLFYITGGVGPFWIRRMEDPRFFGVGSAPGMKSYGLIAAFDSRTNKIVWQKELPYSVENGSGLLATAGGLGFHGHPDGTLQAWDLKTGEKVWEFQTGAAANGPASSYEVDGEQYVALVNAGAVWTFKLGGTLAPQPAPPAPPTTTTFRGRIEATDKIQISAPIKDMGLNAVGERIDENAFKPQRAKVKAGTKVTWTNAGKEVHEVAALDGTWTTGPIKPGATGSVTLPKGVYTYICKGHPWAYAELTVE